MNQIIDTTLDNLPADNEKNDSISSLSNGFSLKKAIKAWFVVMAPIGILVPVYDPFLEVHFSKLGANLMAHLAMSVWIVGYYIFTKRTIFNSLGTNFNLWKNLKCLALAIPIALPAYIIVIVIRDGGHFSFSSPLGQNAWCILYHLFTVGPPEEWYFRGFAYDVFGKVSRWKCEVLGLTINFPILCSTIAFIFIHLWSPLMFFTIIPGFVCGILREKTGNILAPAVFHAAWNILL